MDYGDIAGALKRLNAELPGWWWSVGWCQVSADATIAPHGDSEDIYLVATNDTRFDQGFDIAISRSANVAAALHAVIDQARYAKAALSDQEKQKAKIDYAKMICRSMLNERMARSS